MNLNMPTPDVGPEESFEQRKQALFSTLAKHGIHTVTAEYDGEGDSGQINEISAFAADDTPVALNIPHNADGEPQRATLHDCLEDFCWDILELHHDGFEINDGGFGTFTFSVPDTSIQLCHNDRFVDVTTTTTEV